MLIHKLRPLLRALAWLLTAAAFLGAARPGNAQGSANPKADAGPLGINLDELKDWNPTLVFVDAIKNARPWIPQLPWTNSPWNTGAPLNVDANGWPILGFGQAAGTLMFKEIDGHYPAGEYDVFYDGVGTILYGNDASLIQRLPGHDRIWVSPSDNGIHLKITEGQAGNHVRNIRVILPGFEQSYQTTLFHPLFLQRLERFGVLRFMQWQNTNFTPLQNWWQRPTPSTWTQSGETGVCVEYMCDLANQTDKAPWFCLPHTATDNFIREFARLCYQRLEPGLPIFIEYSNEVWNSTFPAFEHARTQGTALGLDPNPYNAAMKWYSERSVQIFELFRQEWQTLGGAPALDRIVRVLASQSANPALGVIVMDWKQASTKADAYAIAPYFGHSFGEPQNVWATISKSNAQIIEECRQEVLGQVLPAMQQNAQNTISRGLTLIAYEGGQHLVGTYGAQSNTQLVQKLVEVNRDPGMYALYRTYLEAWKGAGGKTMVPYTLCGSYTSWGSWGHLEWTDQPLTSAHKFRALMDWDMMQQGGAGPIVNPAVSTYGQGCYGLSIGSSGTPKVGGSFQVTLSGGPWWQQLYLFASTTKQDFFGLPLPLDLTGFGSPGCTLEVGGGWLLPSMASAVGAGSQTIGIPANPGLAGLKLYFQWAGVMTWVGPLGLGLSNALEVTVGS
jgi:hypothetical protein